ncbi:hypothetical protein [Desulfatiferula olefinivorans]
MTLTLRLTGEAMVFTERPKPPPNTTSGEAFTVMSALMVPAMPPWFITNRPLCPALWLRVTRPEPRSRVTPVKKRVKRVSPLSSAIRSRDTVPRITWPRTVRSRVPEKLRASAATVRVVPPAMDRICSDPVLLKRITAVPDRATSPETPRMDTWPSAYRA